MPHGKASRKRNWQHATKAKAAARKAERRAAASQTTPVMTPPLRELVIPTVTEDDLLSFQFSHFGDDTKPDAFFVDPETALNYRPELEGFDDDGLGWYDDGVKRTLTDEQIQMFRHSEIQQLLRLRRLQADAEAEAEDEDEDDDMYEPPEPDAFNGFVPRSRSPMSDASSLEAELLDAATPRQPEQQTSRPKPKKLRSRNSRSESVQSGIVRSPRSRQRKVEVPYDKRNKRKWESYIDREDPVHGSMTHRRMVRELDGQQGQTAAMDYGDDEPAPSQPTPLPAMPGRRIISYEDD